MSDDKILKCSKKSKVANTFVPMIDVNFILIKLMLFLILKWCFQFHDLSSSIELIFCVF